MTTESENNARRILVTGGLGFIGSNFCNFILKRFPNDFIVILDKLDYCSSQQNLEESQSLLSGGCGDRLRVYIGDLRHQRLLEKIMKEHRIDHIVHFAAQSHVDNSYKDPDNCVDNNIHGTLTLLKACRNVFYNNNNTTNNTNDDAAVLKKMLHISTDEVYGENLDDTRHVEDDALNPTNPYAASKAAAEHFVGSFRHSYGMPILMLRANNVYGPYQHDEKLIPRFCNLLLQGKSLTIQGTGSQTRSFLFAEDIANAVNILLERGRIGQVYNIASSQPERSVLEIATLLSSILVPNDDDDSNKLPLTFIPDRPFNDRRYWIDATKISNELGWKEQISFEDGIVKTANWFKAKHQQEQKELAQIAASKKRDVRRLAWANVAVVIDDLLFTSEDIDKIHQWASETHLSNIKVIGVKEAIQSASELDESSHLVFISSPAVFSSRLGLEHVWKLDDITKSQFIPMKCIVMNDDGDDNLSGLFSLPHFAVCNHNTLVDVLEQSVLSTISM